MRSATSKTGLAPRPSMCACNRLSTVAATAVTTYLRSAKAWATAWASAQHQQHQPGRHVGPQQRPGNDAAEQGAGHAAVAPLQGLRQAAAQHHHDGQQDPVVVRLPGQHEGQRIGAADRQRRTHRMAQRRRVPAPQRAQRLPGPAGRADEQPPGRAHHGHVGQGLAARERHQVPGLVVQAADAAGQRAGQRGGDGSARHRLRRPPVRGSRDLERRRQPPEQQRIGQALDRAGQRVQPVAQLLQAPACPGLACSVSRSSSLASRWSRISSTCSSMPAELAPRRVRGASSTRSRAACSWSASAACCCISRPISGAAPAAASAAGANWGAWVRIKAAMASRVSARICAR